MIKILTVILTFLSFTVFGQIQHPNQPKFENFQPHRNNRSHTQPNYNMNPNQSNNWVKQRNNTHGMSMAEKNRAAMRAMGVEPPMTPEEQKVELEKKEVYVLVSNRAATANGRVISGIGS